MSNQPNSQRWKTSMYLDLMEAQSSAPARKAEHDRTAETLKDLIACARERGDADMEDFFKRCLAKLESGYDL